MANDYSGERRQPGYPACKKSALILRFDGKQLLLRGGAKQYNYPAVSGKAGKYDPVPKGRYWISPAEVWEHNVVTDLKLGIAHLFDQRITRQGHIDAWGRYRITIHPYPETQTGGRGGFFIHGGKEPGSKGCIDLTSYMDSFIEDLQREVGFQRNCFIDLTVE